jgi:hypothetical protein
MAKFDEVVTILSLTLSENEKAVSFTKAHVYGSFVDMAAKGSDQAIMGSGRSAEIAVDLRGEPGSALAGCGGSRINALEGFTAADLPKGNFCTTDGASCRSIAQRCSRACSPRSTDTTGKCLAR